MGADQTTPLFHTDSYVRAFDACVIAHDSAGVVLDRTAFYPGGGGQPADRGLLDTPQGTLDVVDVKRVGDSIVHELAPGSVLAPGTPVHGRLDWDRRFRLMRTHSAMHVLCGVIWRDFGVLVTGGNMEPGRGRLDFDFPALDWTVAHVIEERINTEVRAERPIRVAFHSREEAERIPNLVRTKTNLVPTDVAQIRTIEIVGLDLQADGGTHVANTRDIGPLKVVGLKNKGRANKRLELALLDAVNAPPE